MLFIKKFLLLLSICSVASFASESPSDVSEKKVNKQIEKKKEQKNALFLALENALINNKEILSAQRELMAVHENHVSVSSAFKPNISANTTYQAANTDNWNSSLSGEDATKAKYNSKDNKKSAGIVVKQNLFRGLADVAALKETDLQIRAKWSNYEAIKQKVLRDVAAYYFEIIAKKEEIAHLKALLDSRRESVDVAKEMHTSGAAKYLDVAQANASYAETEAKLSKAESDLSSLSAKFEELTGMVVPVNITTPEKFFDTSLTVKQGIDIAMKHNPGIIAAADALAAAREAIKKPNAKLMPSIDASYSFDQSIDTGSKPDRFKNNPRSQRGHTITVGMTIPIYDGGVGRAEKRQASEMATKAAVDKEKTINETKTEITSAWASMSAARENIASAKKAVEARELALHDTEEEYKAGLKITNDVLKAQQELFEAKYIETQAEKEYFVSQCSATALVGRMNARYLKIKDSDFSYKSHFAKTRSRF